jgi:hypothetical protein
MATKVDCPHPGEIISRFRSGEEHCRGEGEGELDIAPRPEGTKELSGEGARNPEEREATPGAFPSPYSQGRGGVGGGGSGMEVGTLPHPSLEEGQI